MANIGRKTILALAIAAATSVQAAPTNQIDVSGNTAILVPTGAFDSMTLTGAAVRPTGLDGIDFDGPQITGDFTNNATFNLNGDYSHWTAQ